MKLILFVTGALDLDGRKSLVEALSVKYPTATVVDGSRFVTPDPIEIVCSVYEAPANTSKLPIEPSGVHHNIFLNIADAINHHLKGTAKDILVRDASDHEQHARISYPGKAA